MYSGQPRCNLEVERVGPLTGYAGLIQAVMPLRVSPSRRDRDFSTDADRAALTLLSLERQLRGAEPLEIHIVASAADIPVASDRLGRLGLQRVRLVFHDEAALLGPVAAAPATRGSTRQQIIKLAFAAASRARFVITLDSDILLMRPLDPAELVRDGRGVMQLERVATHAEWWAATAGILGGSVNYEQGMSVTPAILSTSGARSLATALTAVAQGEDWRWFLADRHEAGMTWTEYTLYFHNLVLQGLLDPLHVTSPPCAIFSIRSVWRAQQFEGWTLDAALKAPGWFLVIQSSAGIGVEAVRERVAPLLGPV